MHMAGPVSTQDCHSVGQLSSLKADIPVGCCGTAASYKKTDGSKYGQPNHGSDDGKPVSQHSWCKSLARVSEEQFVYARGYSKVRVSAWACLTAWHMLA